MDHSNRAVLDVHSLVTGYGNKQVVNGVDVQLFAGETIAVIGHNGAGKSTLVKAIFGLIPVWTGKVAVDGTIMTGEKPAKMIKAGLRYVPQGARVFGQLTVRENLEIGGITLNRKRDLKKGIAEIVNVFPALNKRLQQRAASLSGGEKQMLAVGCALLTHPRLLLLDEPSMGLAQGVSREFFDRIHNLSQASGVSCLLVEQKVREALRIANRVVLLRNGKVSFTGASEELEDEETLRRYYA